METENRARLNKSESHNLNFDDGLGIPSASYHHFNSEVLHMCKIYSSLDIN